MATPVLNGIYVIRAAHNTAYALNVNNNGTTDGTEVCQWQPGSSPANNEKWQVVEMVGNQIKLAPLHALNMRLTAGSSINANSGKNDNEPVTVCANAATTQQYWITDYQGANNGKDVYSLKASSSGGTKALNVRGGAVQGYAPLIIWSYSGASNELWYFDPVSVPASGESNPAKAAAGYTYSLLLKENGTVWGFGQNHLGQLGDGTTTDRTTPVQVLGMSNVTSVATGRYHALALKSDGTVFAWGYNNNGQLGDGSTDYSKTMPVKVYGLTNVKAVAAGELYSLALKNDGTVWTWGYNLSGQLGDGSTTDRNTPVQVSGLTNVAAIATGNDHGLALKTDGTVWGWGNNGYGQLGNNTTTNRYTPIQIPGLANIQAVAGGYFHTLALKADGTVVGCGYNGNGQLGNGLTGVYETELVQMSGLTNVQAIAGGYAQSLALKTDGTVWTCGWNALGQLGDGSTTDSAIPVQATGLTNIKAISSGMYHSLVIKNDNTVWAFGNNGYGQFGNNTTVSSPKPIQVIPPAPVIPAPVITTASLPGCAVNTAYSATLAATNNPTSWSVSSGALPTGLSLSNAGVISGTPTAAGTFSFSVKATNATGDSAPVSLSIVVSGGVPVVTTTDLPTCVAYEAYNAQLQATNNPTSWQITSGVLPTGLGLNAPTGVIAGTPTTTGNFSVQVAASNAAGTSAPSAPVIITSGFVPSIMTSSLPGATVGVLYSYTLIANGSSPILWELTNGALPNGLFFYSTGVISGRPAKSGTFNFTVKASNFFGPSALVPLTITVTDGVAPENGKTYTIKALHSDKAMVVYMGSAYDGAPVVQMPEAPGYYQQWKVERNGNDIRLQPDQDAESFYPENLRLSIAYSPSDPMGALAGASVNVTTADGSYRQHWLLGGPYKVGSKNCYTLTSAGSDQLGSPKALCVQDVNGNRQADGAPLSQMTFQGEEYAMWYFVPAEPSTPITPPDPPSTTPWIPSDVLQLNGSSAASVRFRNAEAGFAMHWNQEKLDTLWQFSRTIYNLYGIQIDPMFLLAIIITEGTGSFDTSSTNLAADGGNGPEVDFAVDLLKANNLIIGKILGYLYYGPEFRSAVSNNQNIPGIAGNGTIFGYCNWKTPIVDPQRILVRLGVYAEGNTWGDVVKQVYGELGRDADGYESYIVSIGKNSAEQIMTTLGFNLPLPTFSFVPGQNKYGWSIVGQ